MIDACFGVVVEPAEFARRDNRKNERNCFKDFLGSLPAGLIPPEPPITWVS